MNDDWAYGNDPDARPWDFQAEECALRACVDRFNSRRYNNTVVSGNLHLPELDTPSIRSVKKVVCECECV